jgi:hypothetical protein
VPRCISSRVPCALRRPCRARRWARCCACHHPLIVRRQPLPRRHRSPSPLLSSSLHSSRFTIGVRRFSAYANLCCTCDTIDAFLGALLQVCRTSSFPVAYLRSNDTNAVDCTQSSTQNCVLRAVWFMHRFGRAVSARVHTAESRCCSYHLSRFAAFDDPPFPSSIDHPRPRARHVSTWVSHAPGLFRCGGNSRAQNATARRYEDIRYERPYEVFAASFAPVSRQFRASFALISRVSRSVIRLFLAPVSRSFAFVFVNLCVVDWSRVGLVYAGGQAHHVC